MPGTLINELDAIASSLEALGGAADDTAVSQPMEDLEQACETAKRAWSGSPLGYHSRVYYAEFRTPPAGARFSMEWGFMHMMSNPTIGDWVEWNSDDAIAAIRHLASDPDLQAAETLDAHSRSTLEEARRELLSILSVYMSGHDDPYVAELLDDARSAVPLTDSGARQALMPRGQFMSREPVAIEQGVQLAPHDHVSANVVAIRDATSKCKDLAIVARRAASHIRRASQGGAVTPVDGQKVFIGHGRSGAWRELKDFVQDRLRLPWDEFNRVPVAGVGNVDRLAEMLDSATIALLVLTAEDEHADGSVHPRLNVVHEAGLFQGKLGFTRAVVMIEDGCEEFTNIAGLGQIRFPAGNISAAFEEIRRVFEREGLMQEDVPPNR